MLEGRTPSWLISNQHMLGVVKNLKLIFWSKYAWCRGCEGTIEPSFQVIFDAQPTLGKAIKLTSVSCTKRLRFSFKQVRLIGVLITNTPTTMLISIMLVARPYPLMGQKKHWVGCPTPKCLCHPLKLVVLLVVANSFQLYFLILGQAFLSVKYFLVGSTFELHCCCLLNKSLVAGL